MAQRIKVLQIIDSLSVGGAERLLINLAHTIDASRFDMHVCSINVIYGNALQSDLATLAHPPYVIGAKKFYDLRTPVALARYIKQHNIDLIHTHLMHADILGRCVGHFLGIPVISTLHNQPYDYDRLRIDRRWMERLTTRHLTNHLVGVSHTITELFRQEWRIPTDRISTIYNAIVLDEYLRIPEGTQSEQTFTITNIGRLTKQKAQHVLLNAASTVLQSHPNVRFQLVGQGDLEQPLREQAERLGIADHVTFAGIRRDIPAVLAETDVFVLSSLWEGLPLTAIEAMAAARPVVLTDVGGNCELVQGGRTGLLVPPNDVAALANALTTLIDNTALRQTMGQAARARVSSDFNISTFTTQYQDLYEMVVHKRRTQAQQAGLA